MEGLDLTQLAQIALGGATGSGLTALLGIALFKSQEARIKSLEDSQKSLAASQEARIKNLEDAQIACEGRYNMILSHVLSMKG